jgi:hypothetical protein
MERAAGIKPVSEAWEARNSDSLFSAVTSRFCEVPFFWSIRTPQNRKHRVRYMQNLQQPYSLRLYGKLLIPRLGT